MEMSQKTRACFPIEADIASVEVFPVSPTDMLGSDVKWKKHCAVCGEEFWNNEPAQQVVVWLKHLIPLPIDESYERAFAHFPCIYPEERFDLDPVPDDLNLRDMHLGPELHALFENMTHPSNEVWWSYAIKNIHYFDPPIQNWLKMKIHPGLQLEPRDLARFIYIGSQLPAWEPGVKECHHFECHPIMPVRWVVWTAVEKRTDLSLTTWAAMQNHR